VWAALSDACHYRVYEIAPTAAEFIGWFQAVEDLLARIGPGREERD
jgi:hypothetical protein